MKKKAAIKHKKINRHEDPPIKITKKNPTIPKNILEDFVGFIRNLYKIDCIYLWENHYRVNVWTETYVEHSVYPKYAIDKSFFLCYDGFDLIDKTNIKKGD